MSPRGNNLQAHQITAVDIFCGAGGLTHGLAAAGIRVIAGYDADPDCKYPYTANNDSEFIQADVSKLAAEDLLRRYVGDGPRILAGCAPCQAFSPYTQGRKHSGRWRLLDKFGDLVAAVHPHVVTMENVPALQRHARFQNFLRRLTGLGYVVVHQIVQCGDYGAPQARPRLVLIASLHGAPRLFSPREFGSSTSTVRTTIENLPAIAAGESDPDDPLHRACALTPMNLARVRASKPGGTWRDWPKDLQLPCHLRDTGKTYTSIYGRMDWDGLSPTITTLAHNLGSGRFGHPEQDRALSLREAALIQTFPHSYKFAAPAEPIRIRSIGRLIGNAVPVLLGQLIGKSIIAHLGASA